jgi:hypothetical protein
VSVIFFNLVAVIGSRPAVLEFRSDARRRLSPSLRAEFGISQVDLSLDKLFRKHRLAASSSAGIPGDNGHYLTTALPIAKWHTFARVLYEFEIKNYQIHELLAPLSRCYREVCFVNSEICLDDGSITSICVVRGRASTWDFPEDRKNYHWERAAKKHGVAQLEDAYEDDSIRSDAEDGMLLEAIGHWDKRVLRTLRACGQA